MAWNSGTFSREHDWTQDQANGIKIRADRHDEEDDNLASGINTCLTKDGQNSPSANLPMATYKHTGVGNATNRNEYAAVGQVQDQAFTWCGTAGGTNNALTLSPSPSITAYAAGQKFAFKSGASASDSTVTVAISGLTTKAIQSDGAALSASVFIEADKWYEITYDGSAFQLAKIGGLQPLNNELTYYSADWVDVASATTTDIGAAASLKIRITGTTTITGLGTVASGTMRIVRFADSLTLTHNGTSLIIPGGANITTAANDTMMAISLGSGNWLVVDYQKASGASLVLPALYQASPSAPTGTTNTTGVMMGLAGSITPSASGRIEVNIEGTQTNSSSGHGCKTQIRYGTGSAPANGAALTGTAAGTQMDSVLFPTPNYYTPFSNTGIITGLTPGTTYWLDLSLAANSSGTAAVRNINITAKEI